MRELVPGDVLLLSAGDRVGVDLEVLAARDLMLDESLVTGESVAVPRVSGEPLQGGTFVVPGEGSALVTATGSRTALARIGQLVDEAERPPSPLTLELRRVVRVVAVIAAIVGIGLGLASLALGLGVTSAFVFAVGVAVALIPEGLLPTVTLSLARGAEKMAMRNALVRRLDAVETLGVTTFICTDKTGTLTQNRMNVVEVVTLEGVVRVRGQGYEPAAVLDGSAAAIACVPVVAQSALSCVTGRVINGQSGWTASGDPMEAALHCLALRVGVGDGPDGVRLSYSPDRMISSCLTAGRVAVIGASEAVFAQCASVPNAEHLFHERDLRSVTANTRSDGKAFLGLAQNLRLRADITRCRADETEQARSRTFEKAVPQAPSSSAEPWIDAARKALGAGSRSMGAVGAGRVPGLPERRVWRAGDGKETCDFLVGCCFEMPVVLADGSEETGLEQADDIIGLDDAIRRILRADRRCHDHAARAEGASDTAGGGRGSARRDPIVYDQSGPSVQPQRPASAA